MKEIYIDAKIENIPVVTAFVDEELKKAACPKKAQTQIDIAIDELFGYIACRACGEPAEKARVSVDIVDAVVEITFSDSGIPCNPLSLREPEIYLSTEERHLSGLGILLVRKIMDDISYAYRGGENVLTIRKTIVQDNRSPAEKDELMVRRETEATGNAAPVSEASLKSEDKKLLKNDALIRRVVRQFLINSVLSMMFLYAGSLIDTLIVGYYLGEAGLGAMSLVSPVYLVFYTVGAAIGIGGSISASQALGLGDCDGYRQIFTISTLALAIGAVIMCGLFFAFLDPIVRLLSNGQQTQMVREYLLRYIPGGGMTMLSYIPLYFLKTDGRPKASSALFAMSAVINVLLSWLFMSPLMNMGIGGASLATSISMGAVVVIGFLILPCKGSEIRFASGAKKEMFAKLISSGIPNGLSNLMESARIFLVNRLFLFVGAAAFLPCYTVVRNISDILGTVMIGISSAVLPLIGIFYGEEDYVSERQVFRLALKYGFFAMIPLVVLVSLIPEPLFNLFGVFDAKLIHEGKYAIPFSCAGLIAANVNMLYFGYLTAIKREQLAGLIVILRLFAVLAAVAFPMVLLFGSKGIWLSLSLTELVTMLLFFVIRAVIRKKQPWLDHLLLDRSKEHSADITFSVSNKLSDIMYASEYIQNFCRKNHFGTKKSMQLSLAIEEILTFLIKERISSGTESFVDIRIHKTQKGIMMRFRYVGEALNPLTFYTENAENREMQEELLGLRLIFGSAMRSDFRQILGVNNLILEF